MGRSVAGDVTQTARNNSAADQTAATSALTAENADIGNYESQLSKFASSNPYTQGGEFDTATDQKLSSVADAGSGAIQNQEQTIAKRTGENAGSGEAIAAEAARANQRQLSSDEATSTQQRIGDEAGYNDKVLSATAVPAQIEEGIYGTSLSGANSALNTAVSSNAQDPTFWDEFGEAAGKGLGSGAAGLVIDGEEGAIKG